MRYARVLLALLLSVSVFLPLLPGPVTVHAQDLVGSEDLGGGSSVFVFRESRKKSHARSAGSSSILGSGGSGGGAGGGGGSGGGSSAGAGARARTNAQIAAAAKKRRLAAIAARKRAAVAAANRKLALSNTLTAKAEEFLDNDQTDLAITNYRAALVQNPKNTRATEGLSNALTAKGIDVAGDANNVGAAPYFEEAVKLDKQNDVAYAKLGALYDTKGERDKAIENYEKAIAINPDYSTLYAPLGLAYLDAGEIAKAETCLQKAEAGGVDTVETRFLRGVLLFKQNKDSEALASFDRALELDPRFAAAQHYRGQALDRIGKQDQAVAAYQKTLVLDPAYSPASFDLGVSYYNKGDYTSAAAAYQNVVKNDPNNYQAHYNLASTYRQLERYPDANAEYKLAEVGIKTAELYSEWGYCLGKTKEWDQSVARLTTAKNLNPDAIDNSNLGWGYYNAGNAKTAAKNDAAAKTDYDQAKTYLQKAVDQDAKFDAAYLNLGSTHNALGEFQTAVNVLKVALGLRRDWVIATNQLGLGYRGLNDLTNAVAMFKHAVDLDGRNTYGLFNLGEAYNASGNKKEAKKINDRLKKIDPTLAARLDSVIAGRVVDAAKQKIEQKIPKVPRIPF